MPASAFITTEQIFERYRLPQLLQTHLWRTASLMELLLNHWHGPELDKELLIETMLLHDLGNLVKFDLTDTTPIMLLSETELPMYRSLQAEWHQKYGKVVDAVTVSFIKELHLTNGAAMSQIILAHTDGTKATTVAQDNWSQKLCDYTDFRIAPHGLVTLQQRFDDLSKRYAARESGWETPEKVAEKLSFFTTIESQLQAQIDRNLSQIVAPDLEPLARWKTHHFSVIPE